VGLHLVLVLERPLSPVKEIPDLVDENGELSHRLTRAGISFFFSPRVKQQLETEIRAQFHAFRQTGLALDHVNAHNHMHLHPTVLRLILRVGREYGLTAVRLPHEPPILSWRASKKELLQKMATSFLLSPWLGIVRSRLRRAKIKSNDFLFGMRDSGGMNADLVLRFLQQLPEGVTEMYFHPATRRCPEIDRTMSDYQHETEFRVLTNPRIQAAIRTAGIQRITFSDL
jgi:hopanoid biosynthesis associated protein HpnK